MMTTGFFRGTLLGGLLAAVSLTALAGDTPAAGSAAPDFRLMDQTGEWHTLEDYRGKWVALYFYPKADTPGCTTEACNFRDNIFAFRDANAQILGVSFDDVESHQEFAEEYNLPFPLLADIEGKAAENYGVATRKLGMRIAKRETFLIDPAGWTEIGGLSAGLSDQSPAAVPGIGGFRALSRRVCSCWLTSSQYLSRMMPDLTIARSIPGTASRNSLATSSLQNPITRSTPARLYQLRSKITTSPAAGRCGK